MVSTVDLLPTDLRQRLAAFTPKVDPDKLVEFPADTPSPATTAIAAISAEVKAKAAFDKAVAAEAAAAKKSAELPTDDGLKEALTKATAEKTAAETAFTTAKADAGKAMDAYKAAP